MKRTYLFRISLFMILASVFTGCATVKLKNQLGRDFSGLEAKYQHHSGFMIYDLATEETIYEHQSDRYFTPASNTKIFTLYTSFEVLGDSIPGLKYLERGDSLIFWGTGDPSLLYEEVVKSNVYDFLLNQSRDLYFSPVNFDDQHYGPGWAWDDYSYYYQVEKSPLPVFGNYFLVSKQEGKHTLTLNNPVFKKYFWLKDSLEGHVPVLRQYGSNAIDYFPAQTEESFTRLVPFKYSPLLITSLLSDTLKGKVRLVDIPFDDTAKTLYSVAADSLYRVLMQRSDNFIAEQLLLLCAGTLTDTLRSDIAINYAIDSLLADLPDVPIWVDGSGLSRYNLFTPRSIVKLWEKLYHKVPRERLFPLLAIGGETGTIRNLYNDEQPYIYGKTGTLRNNHCLSGFLLTKSGKTLIFSFMNSNYPVSSSEVKQDMEQILKNIRDNY